MEIMKSELCRKLNCEVPIFAFSHCRDVVVEVTKAGGFGVFGAQMVSPEQLERELRWIDDHVEGRNYGVDVLISSRYDKEAEQATGDLRQLIPAGHRSFMNDLLDAAGIPDLPPHEKERLDQHIASRQMNGTPTGSMKLIDVALEHPQVKLIVSGLGSPGAELTARLHARGLLVGGICGKAAHVRHLLNDGCDLVIAQGAEAGGHTGTISTLVLVPQVVDACAGRAHVLAAGGISRGSQIAAALALGAEGVWCGTVWLGTVESELSPFEKEALFAAKAEDAVQRKVLSGKPVRLIKSKLSEAWEAAEAPDYLLPPFQGLLFLEARARIDRAQRSDYWSSPAGQAIGTMSRETTVREVMYELQAEYIDAMERLSAVMAHDAS